MASAQGGAAAGLIAKLTSGLSFGGGGNCIGLSIGASSIKIAEMKRSGKGSWSLVNYASVGISDAVSEQREIINGPMIASAIIEVVAQSGIKAKQICSSIVGGGVIIKTLTIVVTDMKELNDQVFWEAEQYIPFDISEVVVDYQVINKSREGQVEVLLVAVKRDLLDQYLSVIESAKLEPKIMDVEVFALQNLFETNYQISQTDAALLVDVGAMSTKTIICAGGIPLFTKDAPFGGNMVTQEIQRELKLPTFADAETLKTSGNLPHEVGEITVRMAHILAAELKKSVDFYTASSLGPPVNAVYITGGASRAAHLTKILEEYVKIPVIFLNPFEEITADTRALSQEFLTSVVQEVSIPMGLAIRAGDKK